MAAAAHFRMPYVSVADPRLAMRGKDAPRSTVFGALGVGGGAHAFVGGGAKSLGGLVADTKTKAPGHHYDVIHEKDAYATEHGRFHKNHTEIPGAHMGMVPYAGAYMKAVGSRLP
jgi:hypothetical protein